MGNTIVSFASVVDAVASAVAWQRKVQAFQKEQEESRQQIDGLMRDNEQLKKDCTELQHSNNQLSIVDPECS